MHTKTVIVNGRIFTGTEILSDRIIVLENDKVSSIIPSDQLPAGAKVIDANGGLVSAGLIDLQIYGAGDQLFSAELTSDSLAKIEDTLLKQGCTSYLLCLATNTIGVFKTAIAVVNKYVPRVALGLHLEGPFLNAKKRGAHPEELIIKATAEEITHLLNDDHKALVKMMTVAPELLDADCLSLLLERGILLSAGHSNATFEEATAGFDSGIQTATHLFNAMSAFHHRETGLPGAVFNHQRACASIILDGIHVNYEAAKVAKRQMGERLFMITDAVARCDKGIYKHILNVDHYVLPDGTLSGSALTMLQAVKNAVLQVDIPLEEALRMATLYPANLIGRTDLGRIEAGATANIIVFDDAFGLQQVVFEGELIDIKG
ncbi:N-acetylglucosamine-6-phosphate deacetylase [Sphingobacterium spiritivorum]|uniref:N-acetylglucosamine-6-phosphate deacetylase n=1 Tax=Sphingobacterium spiritivorum ATCC 33861 TaxID=525373 RepID=D7VLF8_SPHSI|nr:N-acetylglucosamine-6-phosphate deacetylase [Sphingobacterium spiritivorum]EFK58431.1 N-acetylglucosamine-6-phosphate deacetylase [Sphingobacterium spiritivorum ATCC 33861]QQT37173.1 N-acetylglucosamine-6-phosphate deacetylase [Sphingobacterium spiritivorum]WQD33952.1 N-acetylglucosamine-6-phosphate deacetylase [Sphingobacterium spiritivorum]SUJ29012.1 N-acetylglucosamine-6-phosphate deacetylase [Sphingobacterium spiritivorum]